MFVISPTTRSRRLVSAILLAFAVSATATARTPFERVESNFGYPGEVKLGEAALRLNGDGRLKYKWGLLKFHLYDAALYSSETSRDHGELLADDVAKVLVLDFARSIDQKKMREAFSKSFDLVATKDRRAKHAKAIDEFLRAVRSVKDEHRWVITTAPGAGLSLKIRSSEAVSFGDADFAKLFFELYLAPKAPNEGLRKDLLNR